MPFGLGPWELILVLAIALVIFGTGRLTGIGKTAGTAIREFRQSLRGNDEEETAQKVAEGMKGEDKKETQEEDEA